MPGLVSRGAAIEKGPWYLVGLQELLHWLPWPQVAVWLALLGLLALILLPVVLAAAARLAQVGHGGRDALRTWF